MERILELNPGLKLQHTDPKKYSKANLLPQGQKLDSSRQVAAYVETQGILLRLFARFIKIQDDHQPLVGFHQNKVIHAAVDHICKNLSRPIEISELAWICNLSNDYFSRLFLRIMGTRPIDYINWKRIESAQMMLVTTNDSIEKIAIESGIDNFPYFNRMFKKYSCNTPGEYRKLHKLV